MRTGTAVGLLLMLGCQAPVGETDGDGGADSHHPDSGPLPPDMLLVPGGAFVMGCDGCAAEESPARTVTLSDFGIDRTEVSQANYRECMTAGACSAPWQGFNPEFYGDLPVTWVTWTQADTYCHWAGKRLPTEAEWEKAARGTDGRQFPWGTAAAADCAHANVIGCAGYAEVVDSYAAGASPYGALNMLGNVLEWVADWYAPDYYATAPDTDPQGPSDTGLKAQRGGAFNYPNLSLLAVTYRDYQEPDIEQDNVGFRCAR